MALSAIVPTHDRPAALRRCLETLRDQKALATEFEVVVVDDGSASDIATVVATVARHSSIKIRYERQDLLGLNSARNRGASVARGDVVAFLDDDTLVSSGWAQAMLAAFAHKPCAAVGGRVELELAGVAPPWLPDVKHYLAEYDLGPSSRWLEDEPVPVGANCAVRRSDLEANGGFHPGLDRVADSLVSNGDTEFFRRLRSRGGRLWYEPAASVIHCVPAERLTKSYFRDRHRAQGVSDELLLRLEGHDPTLAHQVGLAREVAKSASQVLRNRLHRRDSSNTRFLVSYWVGRLSAAQRGLRVVDQKSDETSSG